MSSIRECSQRFHMREVNADNVTEQNERDLRVPDRTGVQDDRIANLFAGAEEVPAKIERV